MCSITAFLMQDIFGGKVYGILSFEELDMENIFEGIWACASLLHDSNGNIELKTVWFWDYWTAFFLVLNSLNPIHFSQLLGAVASFYPSLS